MAFETNSSEYNLIEKKIAIDDFFFSIHKDWGRQKEYGTEHVDLQMEMNNAMTN